MKLFEKRPLCMILCIMLGAFSLFSRLETNHKILLSTISLLGIAVIFIFKNINKSRRILAIVSVAAIFLSGLLSLAFASSFLAEDLDESVVISEGVVLSTDHTDGSQSTIVIKTQTINNKKDKHKIITFGSKEILSGINTGDTVKIQGTLSCFDPNDDMDRYYLSQGYSAKLTDLTDCQLTGKKSLPLRTFAESARIRISNAFARYTDAETGALITATVVGDRTKLDPNTYNNFKRIGITHILALSGMHLAIISAGLFFVLSLLKTNKKVKMIILPIFILFYMFLTGFSVSVVRAGVMLILSCLLFLIKQAKDLFTNLSIAVFLIVAITPYSVFDLSLWLSAFATLGILLFLVYEFKSENPSLLKRIIYAIINPFLASVFAIGSSLIFTGLSFGTFSILAPISTIIISLLIEILVYTGLILVLSFNLIPLGSFSVFVSELLKGIADKLSGIKWALLPSDGKASVILTILITLFITILLIFDIKRKRLAAGVLVCLYVAFCCSALLDYNANITDDRAILTSKSSEDTILFISDKETTLFYLGEGYESSVERAVTTVTDNRLNYIDNLIFVNYFENQNYTVEMFASALRFETVYIPAPKSEKEQFSALSVADTLSCFGTKLDVYSLKSPMRFGNAIFTLLYNDEHADDPERCSNVIKFEINNTKYVYLSRGSVADFSDSAPDYISDANVVIFGAVGEFPGGRHYFDYYSENIEEFIFCSTQWFEEECEEYYDSRSVKKTKYASPIYLFD